MESVVLDAVASPRRREILRLVWSAEQSAGAIHRAMPEVTFGAVSLQLGSLMKAGLIDARVQHRNRFYRARRGAFGPVAEILESLWDGGLSKLKFAAEMEETLMPELPHNLTRSVVIQATPETVFRFFTDSARWAAWWGAGSTIDATPGGKVYIRHANGIETLGEVVEVHAPRRIVFTYGFASGKPIPAGGSRVTIRLEGILIGAGAASTRLHLLHEFAEAGPRDEHVQGWRFQLSLFANAVANEVFAGAASVVDEWYAVWAEPDAQARAATLARTVALDIRFRDRYSLLDGLDDLAAHIAAAQRFMPGIVLRRKGEVRHCQGTVLSDWSAVGPGGQGVLAGTNVFVFNPDGRIAAVTGFIG